MSFRWLCSLALGAAPLFGQSADPNPAPAASYEERYDEVLALAPRADRVASVSGVTLTRDAGEFRLESGTLYLLTPLGGRTMGVAFRGRGTFSFTPPTPIERERLVLFLKTPSLEVPFTDLQLEGSAGLPGAGVPEGRLGAAHAADHDARAADREGRPLHGDDADFYGTYRGRRASTEDFQRVVERHIGMDMDWFFNQWVYGTAIPAYRVAYKTEPVENGQHRVTLRVEQQDVPDDFRMYVPVTVDLGENRQGRFRVNVQGPRSEIVLPLLPAPPKAVKFNELEGVLADVKMVGW